MVGGPVGALCPSAPPTRCPALYRQALKDFGTEEPFFTGLGLTGVNFGATHGRRSCFPLGYIEITKSERTEKKCLGGRGRL